jgi:hypothetical protein
VADPELHFSRATLPTPVAHPADAVTG